MKLYPLFTSLSPTLLELPISFLPPSFSNSTTHSAKSLKVVKKKKNRIDLKRIVKWQIKISEGYWHVGAYMFVCIMDIK